MPRLFLGMILVFFITGCSVNKATLDNDLEQYFKTAGVEGCFTMLNNADGKITVYNMNLDTTRFLPASTFEIVNSLIALQKGSITSDTMVIPWDKVVRTNAEWNADLNMKQAFKVSAAPYYQEVAREIGKDTMLAWLDSLSYGNKKIAGPVDSFWLNNSLKISPDEQLGLMKRLYFDQLPFRKSSQQIMRNLMVQEDNTAYKLSYKTGWGYDENKNSIGWVIGWVEENNHVYLFTTLLKGKPDTDMKDISIKITKDILTHYGFFQGRK